MSKKQERMERIQEMIDVGEFQHKDIVAHVASEFSVKESTVEKDIESLLGADAQEQEQENNAPASGLLEKLLANKVDGNDMDLSGLASEYEVPEGEGDNVHVLIETPVYSNSTPPKKQSAPRIQKFNPAAWEGFYRYRQGIKVLAVLHLPEQAKKPEEIKSFS